MQTIIQQNKTQPKNRAKLFVPRAPIVQEKMEIGAENDIYEREADAMADKVITMPVSMGQANKTQSGHLLQRKCTSCQDENQLQMKPLLDRITPLVQRREAISNGASTASDAVAAQINQSKGGGGKMDNATQNYMESRFGADFSGVNIHTNHTAVRLSKELNAQAFATGNDIYFNEGKYNPTTTTGKHLLAHELTHTLQQNNSVNEKVQRRCLDESHYRGSASYCRDDDFSPITHSGKTCYRQIPYRDSYLSCPPGEHVCFDAEGNCENSPDLASLAESKESDGSCNWNALCVAKHTAVDVVPAVIEDSFIGEIKREALRALDWHTWYRGF